MPGIIGYMGTRIESLHCILSVELPVIEKMGNLKFGSWGIVYYQSGDILLRTHPYSVGELRDALDVFRTVRAKFLLCRFEPPNCPPFSKWDIQPYRFRGWVFAQEGNLSGFERFRSEMVRVMPSFLGRSLKGKRDAEVVFHLFLSFLYDENRCSLVNVEPSVALSALKGTVEYLKKLCNEFSGTFPDISVLISNASFLVGYNISDSGRLGLYEKRGNCQQCYYRHKCQLYKKGEGARAVLVAMFSSAPEIFRTSRFSPIQQDSFFIITKDITIEFIPGRISAC